MLARAAALVPGIALCGIVTLIAIGMQGVEVAAFHYPYIEALVIAILIGTAIRTVWTPNDFWQSGINFCGRFLLELAVALLGAAVSFTALATMGTALIAGIVIVVVLALLVSYATARLLGLPAKLSILIACGNSICGNSAIAAVAPVIGASGKDITSSIAFTAVLGVVTVLVLPLIVPVLQMSEPQYGVVAGLTVYAVPQVLAATLPIGALSNQIGTLVKLARVMMLGPVVIVLSLFAKNLRGDPLRQDNGKANAVSHLEQFVPWFIVAFMVMAALRSSAVMSQSAIDLLTTISKWLTMISMAALGLGVDLRTVTQAGARITVSVVISLVLLGAMSLALVHIAGVR